EVVPEALLKSWTLPVLKKFAALTRKWWYDEPESFGLDHIHACLMTEMRWHDDGRKDILEPIDIVNVHNQLFWLYRPLAVTPERDILSPSQSSHIITTPGLMTDLTYEDNLDSDKDE
ncbi:hypothetical protein ACHAP5_010479, partial [Fusarium lateritium]